MENQIGINLEKLFLPIYPNIKQLITQYIGKYMNKYWNVKSTNGGFSSFVSDLPSFNKV